MNDKSLAEAGDIIRSSEFADGRYATKKYPSGQHILDRSQPIQVGFSYGGSSMVRWTEVQTRPAEDALGPWTRTVERVLNTSAHDSTRATALFEVVSAQLEGGGHDPYPDGWHVVAMRLDDSRHRTGEKIEFNGRRRGLETLFLRECGFESHLWHLN